MATIVEQAPALPSRPTTPPPHITLNTSIRGTPAAIPNKHIPVCPTGKAPSPTLLTSPQTPNLASRLPRTVLSSTEKFLKLQDSPDVYCIEPSTVLDALEEQASHPLPDAKRVFPWLHGLHPDNAIQLAFFDARRKLYRKVPQTLRGVTVVKAGGDLLRSRLKSAITPEEILTHESLAGQTNHGRFIEADPRDGFSVRNFQIQTPKLATVSDIIIYGDDNSRPEDVVALARKVSSAQQAWKDRMQLVGWESGTFNTFVVLGSFKIFEETCPSIVATDSLGRLTGNVVDFFLTERMEMASMTKASEIAPNVFLGPTPDPILNPSVESEDFDVLIEASDLAQMPDAKTLKSIKSVLRDPERPKVQFEVPGSGSIMPPTWSHAEVDGLLEICHWIWDLTRDDDSNAETNSQESPDSLTASENESDEVSYDGEADVVMYTAPAVQSPETARKVLIHCADGYTESTLLGITYFMYAHGLQVSEAWIRMHRELRRNFFAYPTDVALLTSIQLRILSVSPAIKPSDPCLSLSSLPVDPEWLSKMDGSLPSRILDYMYLGNLSHANNPALLRELGIQRIVSVGEKVSSPGSHPVSQVQKIEGGAYDGFEFLVVEHVQDNGVDGLSEEFERCLDFIERGKRDGVATLVHCRVGVSRSATICIAEVMKELGLSFPRAYCFVRARRLNVIIQPNLRLTYELLKWEEMMHIRRGEPLRRELEWASVAREIAAMNRPYSRG